MQRLSGWWVLVAVILVLSGTMRYHARNSYAAEIEDNTVIQHARALLLDQTFDIAGEIHDADRNGRLIGFRFRDKNCADDMTVVAFSISVVAKAFVLDFVSGNDAYKFHYYGHSYTSSSLPVLMALWVKSLVFNGLNLGGPQRSKQQLAVIWPKNCPEPALDWSRAWIQPKQAGQEAAS